MSDQQQHEKTSERDRLAFLIALVVGLVNATLLLWLVVVPAFQDDEPTDSLASRSIADTVGDQTTSTSTSKPVTAPVTDASALPPSNVATTDDPTPSSTTTRSTSAPTTTSTPTTTLAPISDFDSAADDVVASSGGDENESADDAAPDTPDEPAAAPSYPILPDGRPVPIQAIYNGEEIVLSGPIPSESARERLVTLAKANSKSPTAEVIDFLTLDPTVPSTIGVRVTELQSIRFPSNSSVVTPEHALELDRVAGIMNALPDITVLILGHADQRGSAELNYQISDDRAHAVADYLALNGISPLRITARPVGEEELLLESTTKEALALNRRTEFVFYGLLNE